MDFGNAFEHINKTLWIQHHLSLIWEEDDKDWDKNWERMEKAWERMSEEEREKAIKKYDEERKIMSLVRKVVREELKRRF